jgi:putative flippase GtrA
LTKSTRAQATSFLVAGSVNTLVTYFIYLALLNFVSYRIAFSITFIAGIFIAYFLNTRFVFDTPFSVRKLLQYPLIYLFQYIAGLLLLMLLVDVLKLDKRFAPLVNVVLLTPLTFVLSRWLLARKNVI